MEDSERSKLSLVPVHKPGLKRDKAGQMAFSMVAVMILLVAGASVAVYGSSEVWRERSAADLATREKACQEAFDTVRESAYIVAWSQLNSSNMDLDTARLSFLLAMNETIRSISPYRSGASLVTLNASRVDIGILTMPETSVMDSPDIPAFFCITGNVQVNVTDGGGYLERESVIKEKMYLPVPLLSYLSSRMKEATEGGSSALWKCVRYELSSLVQLRALQDPEMVHDQTKTTLLLTDADVQNAIILATIIQQRSILHCYDECLLGEFLDVPGRSIFPSAVLPYLECTGTLDPADLFLILYGFEEFPVHDALAQALFASADMMALRYLDYLQVIDLVDFLEETVQTGILIANDVISWVLGKDVTSTQAIDWVKGKMNDAGNAEDTYRYLWSDPVDWVIEMSPSDVCLYNSTGGRILLQAGGNYTVDIPKTDLFSSSFWKNAYVEYTKGTNEASDALISYFEDLAQAIADRSKKIFIELTLDPFDGISPLEDLSGHLRAALDENRGWFANAQGCVEVRPRPDPLGEAMAQTLSLNEASLYGKDGVLRDAFCSVTERMYAQMVEDNPDLRDAPHEENLRLLREAAQDPSWGLWPLLTAQYDGDTAMVTEKLRSSFLQPEDANFISKFLIKFSSGLIVNTPFIESWVEGQLNEMMDDVLVSQQILGLRTNITMPPSGRIALSEGLGPKMEIIVDPRTSVRMDEIVVVDPVLSDGSIPSIHITDLCNASHSPFQTCWDVQTAGSISITIAVMSESGMFPKLTRVTTTPLGAKFRLCAVTGWPLAGVDYRPDRTLSGDALAVLQKIWSWLSDIMGQIGDGAYQLLTWVQQAISENGKLLSTMFEQAVNLVLGLIEAQRNLCEGLLVDGTGILIEAITGGAPVKLFDTDFLGTRMCVELNQGDLSLASAKNIVKITIGFSSGTSKFSVSGRLIKVHGDYQFLANGTIMDPNSRLNLVIDPFLTAYSHLVEVTGFIGGTCVQLYIPEVASFTTYKFGAADIPGLGEGLKNIPSPVPGTKININFGLNLNLATDAPPTPVINEFESNPTGTDSGREWVEIFNPSGQVITLSGWTLQTTHGKVRVDELGDVLLLPYSRIVYTLPGQALDNGDTNTFPWTDGIALIDPEGKRVDVAPTVMDKRNDGRTWQRADDASERWVFKTSTKGQANSHVHFGPIEEVNLASLLLQFFNDILNRMEASGWSLDSLAYAFHSCLWSLMDRLFDAWGNALVEAGVFFDVAFTDVNNALSVGMVYSVKVDSEFIRTCWEWVCGMVAKLMTDPLNSNKALLSSLPTRDLFEHIWFGVQYYFKVSKPGMMESMLSAVTKLTDTNLKFCINLKVNLAAAGILLGKDLGTPRFQIGVGCIVSAMNIKGAVGNLIGDRQTEMWVFKLSLNPA